MGPEQSKHTPALVLHGGIGSNNQMYHQANMLLRTRWVILKSTLIPYLKQTELVADIEANISLQAPGAKAVVATPTSRPSTTTI